MHNKMYDSQEAAELLVTHGFYDLALDMGKVCIQIRYLTF